MNGWRPNVDRVISRAAIVSQSIHQQFICVHSLSIRKAAAAAAATATITYKHWTHAYNCHPVLALFVAGTVRYPGGFVPMEERDSLVAALDAFNCVPIFLDPPDQHDIFFNQFCKQTLLPVFHNLLEIYGPVPTGQSGRGELDQLISPDHRQTERYTMDR